MAKQDDGKTTLQLLRDYDEAIISLALQTTLRCVIDPARSRLDEARAALAERIDDVMPHRHSCYQLRTEGLP